MPSRVYIETFGCQMNVADSELIVGILAGHGFVRVEAVENADVALVNTCAVREKAEERVFGRLGWLKHLKENQPYLVVGVVGCMAEHLREALVKRAPHVNVLAGPDSYRRLPKLIAEAQAGAGIAMIDVRLDNKELYEGLDPVRVSGINTWIPIMRGCDKFCTFCVVPYTRGRERSVSSEEILSQAKGAVAVGFKEVTLLGQAVSSYKTDECDFPQLLEKLDQIVGLKRIRYTAPYPSDIDDRLLGVLAKLKRVEHHIHLPVQSGSKRILEDMRRGYSAEDYLALTKRIEKQLPGFAMTTDLIVGYPGETDEDFQATLDLVAEVKFDSAFMFKYSERSGTWAAKHRQDNVPEEIKSERLSKLIALQEENSKARNTSMIGQHVDVLVEGFNPRDKSQKMGRTSCNKPTVLDGKHDIGDMVRAKVHSSTTHTLFASAAEE
ncbi:MAG: tRNA (N6-isopentenyl adenosine(37)-C2)-methylthiotransferase MiaB [Pseudomonadota bacterium]